MRNLSMMVCSKKEISTYTYLLYDEPVDWEGGTRKYMYCN